MKKSKATTTTRQKALPTQVYVQWDASGSEEFLIADEAPEDACIDADRIVGVYKLVEKVRIAQAVTIVRE